MKRIAIISIIILAILFSGVIYLNQVILPVKIKSLIINTIEKQTGKNVTLKSLEFNLFKGLVLRDLVISDSEQVILSTREASCAILIWPIFKKQIIIPGINFKAPYIFLERRQDKSFNLQDIFAAALPAAKKSDFSVSVYKASISSGTIVFQDNALPVKFKKELKNIQLSLRLGLPVSVKFNFKGEILDNPPVLINAWGEYKILNQELAVNIKVKNFPPQEFRSYYNDLGLGLISGLVDGQGQINFKNRLLHTEIAVQGNSLVLAKDKLKVELSFGLQGKADYNLETKKLTFNGNCDIRQANISGLEFLGNLNNLYGKLVFNERSLVADNLKAELLGMPLEVNLEIKDFSAPVLNINTNLNLDYLPAIAKKKFNFAMVNSAQGKAALFIKLQPDEEGVWQLQGSANITGAGLKLGKQNIPVENISATLQFSRQGLSWPDAKFKYQRIDYQSTGALSDFASPSIELKLFSQDLSLAGAFDIVAKKIKISRANGKYLDSVFSLDGDIDNFDPAKPQVDLNGKINLRLEDLNKILDKQYPALKTMRPSGDLDAQFSLSGDISDLKNCFIQAKLSSSSLSLYGLNSQDFSLDYLQERRLAKILAMRIAFYDGVISASGAMNLDTINLPYHLEAQANGIKFEKLKMDTPSRNKNISGTLHGEIKLSGFSNDLDELSGVGNFQVNEGKLWEFNLLQGLGKILFAKDFASIALSDCSCAFLVKDKFVYTDNLKLKSNLTDLSGPFKIGFDGSLEAALNVQINSEMVPLSGTLKDITTAIVGQAGKFGVIKISGTLGQPKYIFKPAVTNIIKGLTDIIFGPKP